MDFGGTGTDRRRPVRFFSRAAPPAAQKMQESPMNKDIIAGKWTQLKGQAQQKWGKLTDDVFDVQQGDSQYLAGKLQEQYGWDKDRAQREVDEFQKSLH
jgi:uncharacterized protein YjbJ (UPF0337 family)